MASPLRASAMVALFWANTTTAQTPAPRHDPADASVPVPRITHRSALTDYKPLTDEPLRNWREANDEAARIGGWREYLRESQANRESPPAKPAADSPLTTPVPAPTAPASAAPVAPRKPHAHH